MTRPSSAAKLSTAQRKVLEIFVKQNAPLNIYFSVFNRKGRGSSVTSTFDALAKKGLITLAENGHDFRITDAGRAALEAANGVANLNAAVTAYEAPAVPPVNATVRILETDEIGDVTSVHPNFEHCVFVTVEGKGTRFYAPHEVEVYEAPLSIYAPVIPELAHALDFPDAIDAIHPGCVVKVALPYKRSFHGNVITVSVEEMKVLVEGWNSAATDWYDVDYVQLLWTAEAAALALELSAEADIL